MLYRKKISLRWADLDPNFHVRHSVYYDLGAQQRIEILQELGLTPEVMIKHHFGPVLFREECIFRREIKLADEVFVTASLVKQTPDASRWMIRHEFLNSNEKLLSTLTVEGAWIDTQLRKMLSPIPAIVTDVFNSIPKSADFSLIEK
jgi:acyl-CoA thioester hydrolase